MNRSAGTGLALGTVQFGLAYGIAGRGTVVPPDEVRAILEAAAAGGVQVLDTAPVYGDIEARLSDLCADLPFRVVSKIAPVPDTPADAVAHIETSLATSRQRLGDRLETVLFHRADDLLRPDGDRLWAAAVQAAGAVRVGVSAYSPEMVATLRARYGVTVAQLPANALDQRIRAVAATGALDGIELHARSVFLQGLLLLDGPTAVARVPAAAAAHGRWMAWCRDHDRSPVSAAISIVRGLPGVRLCVVGVDNAAQLAGILAGAATATPVEAADLGCETPDVIDPRRWTAA